MVDANDLDSAIDKSHAALLAIVRGDPEPFVTLFSGQDDVTLGNPFGPFARGRQGVSATVAGAAARYSDGEIVAFELVARHVADDLACIVEVERFRARVGGAGDLATVALRVTSIFRPEDGTWRLVHRHADPITTPRTSESILET